MIMEPVFKSYKEQWGKAFGDVVLGSEDAKSRYGIPSWNYLYLVIGC
jgi:hypothetical protein